jgi:hypothetical protein
MEQTLEKEFGLILQGCLSNERPEELLLLWRSRVESMMEKEDIFFLGIYSGKAYMSYPMNLINDVRMLKIFCHLHLEKKIKKSPYETANFSLYQRSHSFDIFNMFDMYTYMNGMAPLTNEERFSILKSFSLEEKRFLLNNLYPDFSESDFSVNESFQFKAFEAFIATDENFEDPPVRYTEKAKLEYLCLNGGKFATRSLVSSLMILAGTFSFGFLCSIILILINVIFLQFGLFFDKLVFDHMFKKLRARENVDSCRRTWRRLQTFMLPMPTDKFALSLCVEEIKNKKHIEFKFCADKYDQTLGYFRLGDVQMDPEIVLRQFPNTGIFFWFSVMSDVKITRRKIKINSYLSVEKFTPEFFLIDFLFSEPYAKNSLSRIMCLSALFELVRVTLEENFPNTKVETIHNGFYIRAPTTHTRVKMSAVARYTLDKLGIGNSCNNTPRYRNLKEEIYKKIVDRIMLCKRDLEAPAVVRAIVPFERQNQWQKRAEKIVETVTDTVLHPLYHKSLYIPEVFLVQSGHRKVTPTLGWMSQFLDYEKKTLDVQKFCERKYQHYIEKRFAPLVAKDFEKYSGGSKELITEYITQEVEKVTYKRSREIKDEYPELGVQGCVTRMVEIVPVCETLRKLTTPCVVEDVGVMKQIGKKRRERNQRKAERRKRRVEQRIQNLRKVNTSKIKRGLVANNVCRMDDLDYVAHVTAKLARRRVRASGLLYTRINKKEFNAKIKVAKARYKRAMKNLDEDANRFRLPKDVIYKMSGLRARSRKDTLYHQEAKLEEYLHPYFTNWTKSSIVEETERFKYFMMRRRLTDYGIPWVKTDFTRYHDTTKNRFRVNNSNLPCRLRNLMRNIMIVHWKDAIK